MKLSDFFPEYPSMSDSDFQSRISQKREFSELRTTAYEETPVGRAMPFKHQEFIIRYLQKYDDLFVIHEPGTGKSCIVPFLTEILKKENPFRAKHTYIIVKKALIKEITWQIVCPCTMGQYEPESLKEKEARKSIQNKLGQWYTIMSYDQFANFFNREYYLVKKNGSSVLDEDKIRNDFDGCIFGVDEIHYLRMEENFKGCSGKDLGSGEAVKDLKENEDLEKRDKVRVYCALWNLFHTCKKIKRIIFTGTPMVNSVTEFGPHMNLLLPRELQFSNKLTEKDWSNMSLEELFPYLNGRVSYVRAKATPAKVIYVSTFPEFPRLFVQLVSEFQEKIYLQNFGPKSEGAIKEEESFGVKEREVLDFIFPDGSFGKEGFNKFIKKEGKWFTFKPQEAGGAGRNLRDYLSSIDSIAYLSSTFADICKRYVGGTFTEISDSGEETKITRPPVPGICFAYSNYIYAVIIPLALAFETLGLERYDGSQAAFRPVSSGREQNKKVYCGQNTSEKSVINLEKKPRFAVLTGDTKPEEFENMMRLLRSYENRHGEYLKILLSSPAGREGININSCLNVDIIDAEWNPSATQQAESRALRSTSYDYLIEDIIQKENLDKDEVKRMLLEGREIPQLSNLKVYIRRHCPILSNGSSIALEMYQVSSEKNKKIKSLLRKVKQLSIDCLTHYERNVRPTDTDFSEECDFLPCRYSCYSKAIKQISEQTYDIYYLDNLLMIIKDRIRDLFSFFFSLSFDDLRKQIPDLKEKYLLLALSGLLSDKSPIIDRFGKQKFLTEDRGTFSLSSSFLSKVNELEYNEKINSSYEKVLIPTGEDFNIENIYIYPFQEKLKLLEGILIKYRQNKFFQGPPLTEQEEKIKDFFKYFFFEFKEPTNEIQRSLTKSASKSKKRSAHKVYKKEDLDKPLSQGQNIILHKLYSLENAESGAKYGVMSQLSSGSGRLRLLTEDSDEFRDVLPYERDVYDLLIQKNFKNKIDIHDIYGIIFNNVLSIVDHTIEKNLSENARSQSRGRTCSSMDLERLIQVLWHISSAEDEVPFPSIHEGKSKQDMIIALAGKSKEHDRKYFENLPKRHLEFFYDGLSSSKETLCSLIRERLFEGNRLYKIY